MLNYEQIKELIREINSSSLRVFELESDQIRLKLSKNSESIIQSENKINIDEDYFERKHELINETINNNSLSELKEDTRIEEFEDLNLVKSPLVGTFYSSATPGGSPYVEVGDKVKKGDVLCIIEAMKIMNEITSEFDGEIVEILRKDEDIVEFGMDLFKIK